jgi:phosphoribosylformylglycinamidine cyclo-ligase
MLPEGVAASIDKASYEVPAIFKLMQKKGDITDTMMYNTFNMGIGMVLCVNEADVEATMDAVKSAGDVPYVIGSTVAGDKGVILK